MRLRITGLRHVLAALFILAGSFLTASAQQVTYYDFDTPQATPGQMSRSCPANTPASGTLFCFNDGTGQNASPSFLSDTYPAIIDPNTMDSPAVSSTHYAIQMTPALPTQASSMWFGVPQKISNGFTAYFAFKFTPNPQAFATADGVAFVIQNSAGGGIDASGCAATGSGLNIVGGNGGCIGYGGIDNSVAIELDTYRNFWDPNDNGASNDDNHVAVMNCGAGQANSPDHNGPCQVSLNLNGVNVPALIDPPGVTLADGNVHQVVVEYSGPNEATPYLLQIFIDPPFVAGTHTPAPGATPVLQGTYNIGENVNLMNSGSANDSAYVGFTSATGGGDEQHEIMAWTFTPHTPSTQQQPISSPGTPTVFPFGSHVYAVTYPPGVPAPPPDVDIVITATPISPQLFSQLVSGGPFAGSQCQVYDDTGGNCIVYNTSCINTVTNTFTQCPPTSPDMPILVKTAFDNTIQPTSPGFLQGDPFYTQLVSISGDGTTATVTCSSDCSVTPNQTVTLVGSSIAGFNGPLTVLSASPSTPNTFTFASAANGSATGGYITSNNLQNIFVSYSPQRIDGSISGRTLNFNSDYVATSLTTVPTMLSISAPSVPYKTQATVTVTATSGSGTPTGSITLMVDGGTKLTAALSNGVATFKLAAGVGGGTHTLTAVYPATGIFAANTATGSLIITPIAPTVSLTGLPQGTYARLPGTGGAYSVTATTNASTQAVFSGSGVCTVSPLATNVADVIINIGPQPASGNCTVTATWAADANYTSASITQTVGVGLTITTTGVVASPNPSVVGSPVLFTVTLAAASIPVAPTPLTGTVQVFSSGGDPSCTATLQSTGPLTASGSCSITFLTPGNRTITAYSAANSALYEVSNGAVQQSVQSESTVGLYPTSLSFSSLNQGVVTGQTVTLTNNGSAPLTISNPYVTPVGTGNANNFIAVNLCPVSLAVGQTCSFYVTFAATSATSPQNATLQIVDNAPNSPQSVPLTATVIAPELSLSPSPVAFGSKVIGSTTPTTVTITNNRTSPVYLWNISFTGAYASQFSQTNSCPRPLAAGASCTVTVTFGPTQAGAWSSYLTVLDSTSQAFHQVPVTGTGTAPAP